MKNKDYIKFFIQKKIIFAEVNVFTSSFAAKNVFKHSITFLKIDTIFRQLIMHYKINEIFFLYTKLLLFLNTQLRDFLLF